MLFSVSAQKIFGIKKKVYCKLEVFVRTPALCNDVFDSAIVSTKMDTGRK